MLAIGQELVRNGHEVVWCGPVDVLRPLVGPDASVHPTEAPAYRRADEAGMAGVRAFWDGYVVPYSRAVIDTVDAAVTEHRPDVVVADQYAPAGGVVAHRRDVPWATVATGPIQLTPPADLPELAGYVASRIDQLTTPAGPSPTGQVAASAGQPPTDPRQPRQPAIHSHRVHPQASGETTQQPLTADSLEQGRPREGGGFSAGLVVALTTRGLVGDVELPDRCVLTGVALGARPDAPDFPWAAWDSAAQHVLVNTGGLVGELAAGFRRRMAAALASMAPGVQAVFVTSAGGEESFPDNAIVVERVPMLDLLPAVNAVVCHAGGTAEEALAYGVPLVVAPVRAEQVVTARQVTSAGAGIEVSMSDATTADLAAAVRAVLDEPAYRDHAAVIAAEFAAAGGTTAAAGQLAALAAGTPLSTTGGSRWVNVLRAKKFSMAEEFVWAKHSHAEIRAAGGDFDLVVPLREGGSGPALFCAPPLVGASWCYLALLPHIGPDHPVYGLQLRALRRPEPLPVDMAELARDFADQIRITQPNGPYHLFGWSLGGNIAHAIAEELERRGAQVGLLAIGDSTPDLPQHVRVVDEDKLWMLCSFVLRRFGYQPVIEADDPDPMARMLAVIRGRPGLGLHEWPDRRILALPRAIRNSITVAQEHRPGQVHGRVLFLAATQTTTPTATKLASWGDHLDGTIDVVEVDCRHEHLLNPQPVARIGAEIAARLGR